MLNIKNPETEQAVRTLASRLGLSLTEALSVAVQHELERLDQGYEAYLRQLRDAAHQVRTASDPAGWLSDNTLHDTAGLPR